MSNLKKKRRKSLLEKILAFIRSIALSDELSNWFGHNDRMRARRRKSNNKFDRWR